MALQNPKLFGYEIRAALTDVSDKPLALKRLNLPSFDLEVIRGSANEGMIPQDWRSFSRLDVPIVKTTGRYAAESSAYESYIDGRAGTSSILFGNLDINGSISGKAIRYNYIDFDDSNRQKIADISTSRVSAWSSSDARATAPLMDDQKHASISYGAQVGITTAGGELVFGTQGTSKTYSGQTYNDCLGPRLQTSLTPQSKEFNSETPTHKIKVKLGTTDVWLYAMKGIPYTIKGFFRNVNAYLRLTQLKNSTAASWKVVETANSNRYVNFADHQGIDSNIAFRSPVSRERFIHLYYDPDYIQQLQIPSASISDIPQIRLANITFFNLYNNQIRNLPDFNFLTPSLQTIQLAYNPLWQSETEEERFLNPAVIAKFPTTITTFKMGGTFYGSIRGDAEYQGVSVDEDADIHTAKDLISRRFSDLVELDFNKGGGAYFYPDNIISSFCPNVPSTVQRYKISNHDFRSVGSSLSTSDYTDNSKFASQFPNGSFNFADATNLIELNLNSNHYLANGTWSVASNLIQTVAIHNTNLSFPDLTSKGSLTEITASWCRSLGSMFNTTAADSNAKNSQSGFKLDGCDALEHIYCNHSNLKNDRFPDFKNPNLKSIHLYETQIKGGKPSDTNGNEQYVIYESTFKDATSVTSIVIRSNSLLLDKGFEDTSLKSLSNLDRFYYYSGGSTNGNLPDFTGCGSLRDLEFQGNNFSGSIPTFAGSTGIWRINLSNNNFVGAIPSFNGLTNLAYLYLFNNNFTTLGTFTGLGSLYRFEAHNNNIGGAIPDFTASANLYYLILFNNKFNSYTTGSFVDLRRIKYIDLANNNLSQQAINQIIRDMYLNYQAYGGGRRVTINLRNNSTPSLEDEEIENALDVMKSSGWTITYT